MQLAFGEFTLDLDSRRLLRADQPVPMEPKMFDLLAVLIQRRPAVVKSTELDELLWPKVYVSRASLARLVSELRAVLGDSADKAQIIRTVYKTGYAFDAPVTVVKASSRAAAETEFALIWQDRMLVLREGLQVAGRAEDCELHIDADTVSRRHARITARSGKLVIEDLSSTNGTFINDVRVRALTPLSPGDRVRLGKAPLLVYRRTGGMETVLVTDDKREHPERGSAR